MREAVVEAFQWSITQVFGQLGIADLGFADVVEKNDMHLMGEVAAFLAVTGSLKGNVSVSFGLETAKNIVSLMMMGSPVQQVDSLARSALGELSNMLMGHAVMRLKSSVGIIELTAPTIVQGKNLKAILSSVNTLSLRVNSKIGPFEVNIGLE